MHSIVQKNPKENSIYVFSNTVSWIVTFICSVCFTASKLPGTECPYDGRYDVITADQSGCRSTFTSGCDESSQLRVEVNCPSYKGRNRFFSIFPLVFFYFAHRLSPIFL